MAYYDDWDTINSNVFYKRSFEDDYEEMEKAKQEAMNEHQNFQEKYKEQEELIMANSQKVMRIHKKVIA